MKNDIEKREIRFLSYRRNLLEVMELGWRLKLEVKCGADKIKLGGMDISGEQMCGS